MAVFFKAKGGQKLQSTVGTADSLVEGPFLLDEQTVCSILNITLTGLRAWRKKHIGPMAIDTYDPNKFMYRRDNVDTYEKLKRPPALVYGAWNEIKESECN